MSQETVEVVRRRAEETGENAPLPRQTIGLIATEATIASNAYPAAIREIDPTVRVIGRACGCTT